TTVSPSYAEEIQTAYYGERLDGLLRAKSNHLSGILNGIDIVDYDPAHDPMLAAPYTAEDPSGKAENKRALQEQLGLQVRPEVPIIAMVSRLTSQKGLDLVDYVIVDILREDVQLVVLGMGDARYVNLFSWAEQSYPGRVAARFAMDNELAHRIYAGADIFLMPSQFEPCGLSQMIALRYGTVPLVRETGGLRDTVLAYNEFTNAGNGFTFFNYNSHDMLHTLQRALHYYWNRKDIWSMLRQRGMMGDYSWRHSAEMYVSLYESMLNLPPNEEAEANAATEPAAAPEAAPPAETAVTQEPSPAAEAEPVGKAAPAPIEEPVQTPNAPALAESPEVVVQAAPQPAPAPPKPKRKPAAKKAAPAADKPAPKPARKPRTPKA
ncbi:MAG: glycosyltransferase, partial [Clostridiales bacterium]|nr:glycosyltransferase [Clostridiales bacterium]